MSERNPLARFFAKKTTEISKVEPAPLDENAQRHVDSLPELPSTNFRLNENEAGTVNQHGRSQEEILADPESLERLRASRAKFDADLQIANTFQDVLWRMQEEMYWQTLPDVEMAVKNHESLLPAHAKNLSEEERVEMMKEIIMRRKQNGVILSDSGKLIQLKNLMREIQGIEAEDEHLSKGWNINELGALKRRVFELRSARQLLVSEYRNEHKREMGPKGDQVKVYGVSAETLRKTRTVEDETPVLIAAGFSVNSRASEKTCVGVAEEGRPVMTFDVPPNSRDFDPADTYPEGITDMTKMYATGIVRALDIGQEEIFHKEQKIDGIGYSMGAISILAAAVQHPDRFRNIVLIDPAGLSNLDDPSWKRFMQLGARSAQHKAQVGAQVEGSVYGDIRYKLFHAQFSSEMAKEQLEGGLPYLVSTAATIAQTDLLKLIQEAQQKGIGISVLVGEEDPLFPHEEVAKYASKAGITPNPVKGGHANVGFSPANSAHECVLALNSLRDGTFEAAEEQTESRRSA